MRHRTTLIALALIILVSGLLYPILASTINLLGSGRHDPRGVVLLLPIALAFAACLVLPRLLSRH